MIVPLSAHRRLSIYIYFAIIEMLGRPVSFDLQPQFNFKEHYPKREKFWQGVRPKFFVNFVQVVAPLKRDR
ncbi:unnamed protein product [Clonostachys rosea]|uniref:Uncharacterized protein n=1 Tax=Bionectria ochroleuca TaxID=29856 RepID=A0ABY6U4T7_BIOOC|nr:unnamed protein product [Clonostachys rosea]